MHILLAGWCLSSKMSGLRSKQKSAGEVMNHHLSVSSSLCEDRCAGGEGGKTFTSAGSCCALNFVVASWSRRGGFFTEFSSSCTPTFSAHSCVSTCLLWTFFLYTSSHKWGIWKLFLDSLLAVHLEPQICLGGCMFLLALPQSFGSDINKDEFLIRRNKQLSKNVTKDTARALFPVGFFESYLCPRFIVVKIPFPPAGAFVPL